MSEAASAEAYAVAEVADPTPIVLAHIEVIVVVKLEARVAELPMAPILRLLRQLQVSFKVRMPLLFGINLEQLRNEDLLIKNSVSFSFTNTYLKALI